MREIDKKIDNSIKRKKQMRTTTFAMALLVAAIMVSSTIPAMTISDSTQMNENEGQQTQFFDEAISIAHDDFSGMNLGISDKPFEYSGQIRTIVIWNNGMDFDDGWTAQTTQCTYDGEPADDFMFDTATAVMDIHWLALSSMELNCNWYIRFYEDDGSGAYPGTMVNEFYLTPVDVYVGDWSGYQIYDYTADLTGVNCNAGQKYWVSLQADFPCSSTRVFWCMHSYEWQLSVAAFRSDYFTGGIWRDTYYLLGAPYDMCFELTAKFDHDVGVTEIVSPVDYQEMCPCMPVTVKVGNFGAYDEVNVPVHVEITQSAPGFPSSFDEPFPGFWNMYTGLWSVWYGSDWTDPAYVTPHTGYAMAKFDGTNGMFGWDELFSGYADFTQACHPKMCFWMWHDTYGSDDYIQVFVNGQPMGDPLYRFTCDAPGWYKHCIDLGDYAGQFVNIAFMDTKMVLWEHIVFT